MFWLRNKKINFSTLNSSPVITDPTKTKENVDPSSLESDIEITCPEILDPVCHFKSEGKNYRPGPQVFKLFSCSTPLSMKFIMLVNVNTCHFK